MRALSLRNVASMCPPSSRRTVRRARNSALDVGERLVRSSKRSGSRSRVRGAECWDRVQAVEERVICVLHFAFGSTYRVPSTLDEVRKTKYAELEMARLRRDLISGAAAYFGSSAPWACAQ